MAKALVDLAVLEPFQYWVLEPHKFSCLLILLESEPKNVTEVTNKKYKYKSSDSDEKAFQTGHTFWRDFFVLLLGYNYLIIL